MNLDTKDDSNIGESNTLHELTSLVFGKSDSTKSTNDEYTVDCALLDDMVLDALTGEAREALDKDDVIPDDIGDTPTQPGEGEPKVGLEVEVEVEVTVGKRKPTKIKKAAVHESAHCNIIQDGVNKMNLMNLPAIRHRKNKRLAREQVAIRDSIYTNVVNNDVNTNIETIVVELLHPSDGNIFGSWDNEIMDLL